MKREQCLNWRRVAETFVIIGFLAGLLLAPVSAEFIETSQTGTWDICEIPVFSAESTTVTTGLAEFNHTALGTIDDGYGFNVNFTINELSGNRVEWYWNNGVKRIVLCLALTKGTEVAYAWLYLAHEDGVLIDTAQALNHAGQLITAHPVLNGGHYNLRVFRESATKAVGLVSVQDNGWVSTTGDSWDYAYSENFTVSAGFWDSPNCTLYAWHEGVGTADFTYGDENGGAMGFEPTTVQGGYPEWVPDWLRPIFDALTFMNQLMVNVVTLMAGILPLMPILFGFWLLDALITSVSTMELRPIGVVFTTMWEWLVRAGELVVGFFTIIAEAIPL